MLLDLEKKLVSLTQTARLRFFEHLLMEPKYLSILQKDASLYDVFYTKDGVPRRAEDKVAAGMGAATEADKAREDVKRYCAESALLDRLVVVEALLDDAMRPTVLKEMVERDKQTRLVIDFMVRFYLRVCFSRFKTPEERADFLLYYKNDGEPVGVALNHGMIPEGLAEFLEEFHAIYNDPGMSIRLDASEYQSYLFASTQAAATDMHCFVTKGVEAARVLSRIHAEASEGDLSRSGVAFMSRKIPDAIDALRRSLVSVPAVLDEDSYQEVVALYEKTAHIVEDAVARDPALRDGDVKRLYTDWQARLAAHTPPALSKADPLLVVERIEAAGAPVVHAAAP